jgi:hypothetical protein
MTMRNCPKSTQVGDNYSNEAREAFNIVVSKKGGMENLLTRVAERQKLLIEANKIKKAAMIGRQIISDQ